jgi:hypothetical protein
MLAYDFFDAAREWSKLIAASCERNPESELAIRKFDWAFK